MPLRPPPEEASYPRDVSLWEPPATRDKIVEALKSLRPVYERWLRDMGELNPPLKTYGLRGFHHSLLHRLWIREHLYRARSKPLDQILTEVEKVKLLTQISEALPKYRPKCLAIKRVPDCDWLGDLERMVEECGTVYVKTDASFNGMGVSRLQKTAGGVLVTPPRDDAYTVNGFTDKRWESIIRRGTRYLLEAEIPIARTREGETWEIRHVAAFADCHYGKVGQTGSHLNNLSQGGKSEPTKALLARVLQSQGVVDQFLAQSAKVAQRALAVVHGIEEEIAGHVAPQSMTEHFRGTFLMVDVTGVFDASTGTLRPVIVECQPGGSLLGLHQTNPSAYSSLAERCTAQINRALREVKAKL